MPDQIFAMPKSVALDNSLSFRSRFLYGHLETLAHKTGYCWASNEWLGDLMGISGRSVRRDLSELEKAGLIRVEIENKTDRKVYLDPRQNASTPRTDPAEPRTDLSKVEPDLSYPPGQICPTPQDRSVHIYTQDEYHKVNTTREDARVRAYPPDDFIPTVMHQQKVIAKGGDVDDLIDQFKLIEFKTPKSWSTRWCSYALEQIGKAPAKKTRKVDSNLDALAVYKENRRGESHEV
ncbi:MAG: helix-turn-helix domain-containing protein [Rhizobiaceae bacterium]